MRTTITRTAAATVAAGLLLLGGNAAYAKDGDVRTSGRCTASSTWALKLKHDDGRIEAELEVDQNRNGVRWNVLLSDDGVQVFSGSAVTAAPSGSFEIERRIPDRPGTDAIVARATNPATGEVCRGMASI